MKEAEELLYWLDLVSKVALNVSLHFHSLQPENTVLHSKFNIQKWILIIILPDTLYGLVLPIL